jgi:hypothetical protein
MNGPEKAREGIKAGIRVLPSLLKELAQSASQPMETENSANVMESRDRLGARKRDPAAFFSIYPAKKRLARPQVLTFELFPRGRRLAQNSELGAKSQYPPKTLKLKLLNSLELLAKSDKGVWLFWIAEFHRV